MIPFAKLVHWGNIIRNIYNSIGTMKRRREKKSPESYSGHNWTQVFRYTPVHKRAMWMSAAILRNILSWRRRVIAHLTIITLMMRLHMEKSIHFWGLHTKVSTKWGHLKKHQGQNKGENERRSQRDTMNNLPLSNVAILRKLKDSLQPDKRTWKWDEIKKKRNVAQVPGGTLQQQ